MLTRLLHRFASDDVPSVTELSRGLDIDTGMVLQMLMDLERLGYVERPPTDDSSCRLRRSNGCHGCSACSVGRELSPRPQQVWLLTDKGKRRVERARTSTSQEEGE